LIETDDLFPPGKRQETEEILRKSGNQFAMTVYSDVEHGFGLKADLANPTYKFVSETAFLQAINWFDHFLKT
jgi:dienelactone hydrolase